MNPSDILGRTARAPATHCGYFASRSGANLLNDKSVLPVLPKIVVIAKAEAFAGDDLAKLCCSFVFRQVVHAKIRVWIANLVCVNAYHELVQMRICPAHRFLDDPVQLEKRTLGRHEQLEFYSKTINVLFEEIDAAVKQLEEPGESEKVRRAVAKRLRRAVIKTGFRRNSP